MEPQSRSYSTVAPTIQLPSKPPSFLAGATVQCWRHTNQQGPTQLVSHMARWLCCSHHIEILTGRDRCTTTPCCCKTAQAQPAYVNCGALGSASKSQPHTPASLHMQLPTSCPASYMPLHAPCPVFSYDYVLFCGLRCTTLNEHATGTAAQLAATTGALPSGLLMSAQQPVCT